MSLLDADCSSIDSMGEKKKKPPEVKTQYHNTGYVSLSPPLHPAPIPRHFHWLSKAAPQISKQVISTKVT